MADILAGAERKGNGRVIVYSVETGKPYERAADCALDMVRSGQFRTTKDAIVASVTHTADPSLTASEPAAIVADAPPTRPKRSRSR